jgi:hypothetical protein
MGGSIQPSTGTPLSVIAKTPNGTTLFGVTLVAIGLRQEISRANVANGRMDWIITESEFDYTANWEQKNLASPPPAGSCVINLVASMPGTNYGPVPPRGGTFQAGGNAFGQVTLTKGDTRFGPDNPVVLTLIDGCLWNFTDNLHEDIPARNLKLAEAVEVLVTFHKQGVIRLDPEPVFQQVGGNCGALTSPKATPCFAVDTGNKDANGKAILQGVDGVKLSAMNQHGIIDGVRFTYNGYGKKATIPFKKNPDGTSVQFFDPAIGNLDVRNAVGLVRLVRRLKAKFNITEFHHSGIGSGTGKAVNCHNQGRAVDFTGVRLPPEPGVLDGLISVFDDWFQRTVPDEREIGVSPKTLERKPDWPHKSQLLEFRLESLDRAALEGDDAKSLAADLKQAGTDQAKIDQINAAHKAKIDALESSVNKAANFFSFMWMYICADFQNKRPEESEVDYRLQGPADEISRIGDRGFIMNPDHKASDMGGPSGREAHMAHLHFQVGPTESDAKGYPDPAVPRPVKVPT